MKKSEELLRTLSYEIALLESDLEGLKEELARLPGEPRSVVIKRIKGKLYYYRQWREDKKIHWKYLGPVLPGVISREEQENVRLQELTSQKKEKEQLLSQLTQMRAVLQKGRERERLVEDFSFEVYWKDEITARVSVQGSRVKVSRYVEHPLKQLFAAPVMTRYQLNQIFELRCWDRNRGDMPEILHQLGLKDYNPYEIVRRTHGVSYNDYIWFRFPGEQLTSKDVLVR